MTVKWKITHNDNNVYYYVTYAVNCSSGSIKYYTSYGDVFYTPGGIASYWKSKGYRVLRNDSGTHIFVVMPYYNGTISGINVSGLSAGIYTNSAMEEFCLIDNDNDSDGIANCFDCDYNSSVCTSDNKAQNLGPSCSEND